jgi:hypothetical protein
MQMSTAPLRAEAREHLDLDGKGLEPFAKGVEMLLGEDGRRDQEGDLLPVVNRLERGAERHLGLAVAHVALTRARARLQSVVPSRWSVGAWSPTPT